MLPHCKTALDPSLRAVVLTACVELGCGRWSSTSCLFSSEEACSPLLSADPEFTPPRSGGYERGDYYTRSWSIMYGRCVLKLLPRTDGSRVASWCASGCSLPSTLPAVGADSAARDAYEPPGPAGRGSRIFSESAPGRPLAFPAAGSTLAGPRGSCGPSRSPAAGPPRAGRAPALGDPLKLGH